MRLTRRQFSTARVIRSIEVGTRIDDQERKPESKAMERPTQVSEILRVEISRGSSERSLAHLDSAIIALACTSNCN